MLVVFSRVLFRDALQSSQLDCCVALGDEISFVGIFFFLPKYIAHFYC